MLPQLKKKKKKDLCLDLLPVRLGLKPDSKCIFLYSHCRTESYLQVREKYRNGIKKCTGVLVLGQTGPYKFTYKLKIFEIQGHFCTKANFTQRHRHVS